MRQCHRGSESQQKCLAQWRHTQLWLGLWLHLPPTGIRSNRHPAGSALLHQLAPVCPTHLNRNDVVGCFILWKVKVALERERLVCSLWAPVALWWWLYFFSAQAAAVGLRRTLLQLLRGSVHQSAAVDKGGWPHQGGVQVRFLSPPQGDQPQLYQLWLIQVSKKINAKQLKICLFIMTHIWTRVHLVPLSQIVANTEVWQVSCLLHSYCWDSQHS